MNRAAKNKWAIAKGIATLCVVLAVCVVFRGFAQQPAHAPQQPHQQQPTVEEFVLHDTIQPVSADELARALTRANSDGAQALLIDLDTPGGLVDSMRAMVGEILRSRVPVIVYVAPTGSRAGSAGFFILESADVAAMAPGTEAGAAHVVFEGAKPDDIEMQKVENDAEAFMRSYVSKRGRNADAAQEAEKSSHSYTPEESLNQHLIDVLANSDAELLEKIDGRTVTRLDGTTSVLHVAGARIVPIQLTLRDQLLGWLVNPNIALLLLVGGALLIYLEFNAPGTIVPGALGTLMVLLAIFAFDLLPIRYTAVLLLVAAMVLLILEAKVGGHGALAIAGIVCLTFGTLTLVAAPVPQLRVSPWVGISVSLAFGCITWFLVSLAWRARRRKSRLGVDAMMGATATAMEALAPRGHVLVEGEIWRAVANAPVAAGAALRVVGHNEMLLQVEPEERSVSPPRAS